MMSPIVGREGWSEVWWKVIAAALVMLALAIAVAVLYGRSRWQSATRELHATLQAARVPPTPKSYEPRELEGLPAPVQRYFRAALREGQPMVSAVSAEHTGTFNMGAGGAQWKAFRSTQRVIAGRPGFVWDARIRVAPAMTVHVHDAYLTGDGVLTATLFGLLTVMKQPSTPELAHGELTRFLAEAVWYPTALLPSQGVVWAGIDDTHASATLTDGATTVRLVFEFDGQGRISSVRSDGRYREVAGALVATPWEGRFWNYELRDGMLIPLDGEVAWLLPDGPRVYWRGRIQRVEHEYAQ